MAVIRTDHRTRSAREVPGADARVSDLATRLLGIQLELARELAAVHAAGHHVFRVCAHIGEYGGRFGLDPRDARALTDLGQALEVEPDLEGALRRRELDIGRATLIARILAHPQLVRPDDNWIGWARAESKRTLLGRVRRRIEEAAQQTTELTELSLTVPAEIKERFHDCRRIASKECGKPLTDGQTLGVVVDDYLAHHQSRGEKPGKRRVGPTSEKPDSRYIPAEVRRAVFARAGGVCEFPGCTHCIWLQLSHIHAHAQGGAREAGDLLLLCLFHHFGLDAGLFSLAEDSTPDDPAFLVDGQYIRQYQLPDPNAPPPAPHVIQAMARDKSMHGTEESDRASSGHRHTEPDAPIQDANAPELAGPEPSSDKPLPNRPKPPDAVHEGTAWGMPAGGRGRWPARRVTRSRHPVASLAWERCPHPELRNGSTRGFDRLRPRRRAQSAR